MSFFSIVLLCIAASGLIFSIISIFPNDELPSWMRNHAVDIFLLFSSFSPAFIFFLLIGTLIRLLTLTRIRKVKNAFEIYQIKTYKIKRKE